MITAGSVAVVSTSNTIGSGGTAVLGTMFGDGGSGSSVGFGGNLWYCKIREHNDRMFHHSCNDETRLVCFNSVVSSGGSLLKCHHAMFTARTRYDVGFGVLPTTMQDELSTNK